MKGCVFCERIEAGDYTERHSEAVSFEPLNPVTPGHLLFVPKRHYMSASTLPLVTGVVFSAAARYAATRSDDFNLITSAGSAATQTIYHLHVHYVPRREGDGLHLPWTGQVKI